jgi:hypothetical protein
MRANCVSCPPLSIARTARGKVEDDENSLMVGMGRKRSKMGVENEKKWKKKKVVGWPSRQWKLQPTADARSGAGSQQMLLPKFVREIRFPAPLNGGQCAFMLFNICQLLSIWMDWGRKRREMPPPPSQKRVKSSQQWVAHQAH